MLSESWRQIPFVRCSMQSACSRAADKKFHPQCGGGGVALFWQVTALMHYRPLLWDPPCAGSNAFPAALVLALAAFSIAWNLFGPPSRSVHHIIDISWGRLLGNEFRVDLVRIWRWAAGRCVIVHMQACRINMLSL